MKVRLLIAVAVVLGACGPVPESQDPDRSPAQPGLRQPTRAEIAQATEEFRALRDEFLPAYYVANPVRATELGIHTHDGSFPDMDRAAVQTRIDNLLDWLRRLEEIPFIPLAGDDRFDYGILEYALRSQLLELEEIRSWVRDPRLYTDLVGTGIAAVAERRYAPLPERTAFLVSRMDAASEVLAAGRENLSAPPRLWTEIAIGDTRGLVTFLQQELPDMLAEQGGGSALPSELDAARDRLVTALRDHLAWLESDLLPRSNGTYRLGRYLFERKLLYEEHIALSITRLDQLNEQAITEYQGLVQGVAEEIDPTRSAEAIMDSIARIHPAPDELLDSARAMTAFVHDWVARSGLVPLPDATIPTIRETLSFDRSEFADMDAPGPFDSPGLEAFYSLTNVLPDWTEERKQEHLTYFSYPTLLAVTVHETYPGHYVQRAYERQVESELRKVFTPRSFVEGWAHYAEQMVVDAGFADRDPAIRLGQLQRALQRHARWYAGLHLHAFDADLEEVVDRFMEIAYFEEGPARREVIRATYDPTYLYYALGRMQIAELRKDYEAYLEEEGEVFSLSDFHERLLRLALPLPLAREALIPLPDEDSGTPTLIRRR